MTRDERAAALRANIAAYDECDTREYVNGAPHVKHASVAAIYRRLVTEAIDGINREPKSISVLELGPGNGVASAPWFEKGVTMTGVDTSERMLREFETAASNAGIQAKVVVSDALDFLATTDQRFDVVTLVSMIHHVPDYLDLLARSAAVVQAGGCLITFQDPLRYDRMPFHHHVLDRASYFVWRSAQGNVKRGLKTRWRRLRGVYSTSEVVDFEDYHLVRNGVDSAAIMSLLEAYFARVKTVPYWSTYSGLLQRMGERLQLASFFGVLASGRKPN
jgi:2-polyprenyl-3-methyl-5-hydroxy-6-metoxy-1,4-benzoquinol methylase